MSQIPARVLQFDTSPPILPTMPSLSTPGAESQQLTLGQPPDSSAAALLSSVPELSATGLAQTQVDTQSMDPSSHTVSTNDSITVATAHVTTTEATHTVSAPLVAPSIAPQTDLEQAVDESAESPDNADFELHIRSATASLPHGTPPPSSS